MFHLGRCGSCPEHTYKHGSFFEEKMIRTRNILRVSFNPRHSVGTTTDTCFENTPMATEKVANINTYCSQVGFMVAQSTCHGNNHVSKIQSHTKATHEPRSTPTRQKYFHPTGIISFCTQRASLTYQVWLGELTSEFPNNQHLSTQSYKMIRWRYVTWQQGCNMFPKFGCWQCQN